MKCFEKLLHFDIRSMGACDRKAKTQLEMCVCVGACKWIVSRPVIWCEFEWCCANDDVPGPRWIISIWTIFNQTYRMRCVCVDLFLSSHSCDLTQIMCQAPHSKNTHSNAIWIEMHRHRHPCTVIRDKTRTGSKWRRWRWSAWSWRLR